VYEKDFPPLKWHGKSKDSYASSFFFNLQYNGRPELAILFLMLHTSKSVTENNGTHGSLLNKQM
jgi:hypothetical protein